MNPQLFLPMAM